MFPASTHDTSSTILSLLLESTINLKREIETPTVRDLRNALYITRNIETCMSYEASFDIVNDKRHIVKLFLAHCSVLFVEWPAFQLAV